MSEPVFAIGLGPQEGIIIIVILVLLFGASRLPQLGKSLGQGIKEFKKASKQLTSDEDEDEKEKKSESPNA